MLNFEIVAGWHITGGEEERDGSAGAGSEGFVLFFVGSFCVCIHFGGRSSDDFSSMSDSTEEDDLVSCVWCVLKPFVPALNPLTDRFNEKPSGPFKFNEAPVRLLAYPPRVGGDLLCGNR